MTKNESFMQACMRAVRQQTFYAQYWKTFEIVRADTDEQKRKAFRLRYKIFAEENGFIDPVSCEDGLEYDRFDDHAIQFLLMHKMSGEVAGTLRLIMPNEATPLTSYELQKSCDHPLLQIENRAMGMCEISRLCMAQRFRKRERDGRVLPAYYEQDSGEENKKPGKAPLFHRRIPFAPLGLMMAAFDAALANGITECVTAYEVDQLYTFNRLGIDYRVLGPRLYNMGETQPLIFNIRTALDGMAESNPECFEVASDKGRLLTYARELFRHEWQDSVMSGPSHEKILEKLV